MRHRFFLSQVLFLSLFVSCKPEKSETPQNSEKDSVVLKKTNSDFMFDCKLLKKEALKMDSLILKQTETNVQLANNAIKAFTDFVYHCAFDSVAPIYLIKTAQIAQAVNNTQQAKVVLEKCITDYPNFKNRAAAIFLLAQLYDETTYLNNEEEAKVLYQKIIDEYPKSDWASSARGALKFIGKSDQQIIEAFNKKKK